MSEEEITVKGLSNLGAYLVMNSTDGEGFITPADTDGNPRKFLHLIGKKLKVSLWKWKEDMGWIWTEDRKVELQDDLTIKIFIAPREKLTLTGMTITCF